MISHYVLRFSRACAVKAARTEHVHAVHAAIRASVRPAPSAIALLRTHYLATIRPGVS